MGKPNTTSSGGVALPSSPNAAPPQYADEPPRPSGSSGSKYGSLSPDVPSSASLLNTSSSSRNTWMDHPADDDLPDDFKVGVTVIDCDVEIRVAFIRKVYSILFAQLLVTSIVAVGMSLPAAVEFTHGNPWTIWVPMLGSLVALGGVYWKRHSFPANMIMLGIFTLLEAVMIGAVTSYYESRIVSRCGRVTSSCFS